VRSEEELEGTIRVAEEGRRERDQADGPEAVVPVAREPWESVKTAPGVSGAGTARIPAHEDGLATAQRGGPPPRYPPDRATLRAGATRALTA